MTPRDRLAAVLAPDVLDAIEALVAERVAALDLAPAASPWLSLDAAAGYSSVSVRTIERAISKGRLRSSAVGSRRLVHRDDLDAWIVKGGGGGEARTAPPRRPKGAYSP